MNVIREWREWMDIALITLAASYKWLLGGLAAIAVVVGALFAAGVFSGGDDAAGLQAADINAPTAVPTLPSPTAILSPTPTPTAVPFPTLAPSPTATPEPSIVVPQMVRVPINLKGAYQLGSLEFVLAYEPSLLEFTGVAAGDLAGDAIIESLVSTPGKVWIAMIDADGVTGDGSLAVVSFRIMKESTADSPLFLENVSGYDASTLMDLISSSLPGLVVLSDGSYTSPLLVFE